MINRSNPHTLVTVWLVLSLSFLSYPDNQSNFEFRTRLTWHYCFAPDESNVLSLLSYMLSVVDKAIMYSITVSKQRDFIKSIAQDIRFFFVRKQTSQNMPSGLLFSIRNYFTCDCIKRLISPNKFASIARPKFVFERLSQADPSGGPAGNLSAG